MKTCIPIQKTDDNGYCVFFERGSGRLYGAYLGKGGTRHGIVLFPIVSTVSVLREEISHAAGEAGFVFIMEASAVLCALATALYFRRKVRKSNFFELYRYETEAVYRRGCSYFDASVKTVAASAIAASVLFWLAQKNDALAWILHWIAVWAAVSLWYFAAPAALWRRLKQLEAEIGQDVV